MFCSFIILFNVIFDDETIFLWLAYRLILFNLINIYLGDNDENIQINKMRYLNDTQSNSGMHKFLI